MNQKIVEKGYDELAEWYYKDRLRTRGTSAFLKKIIKKLPKKGKVLDIGCGVGYPVSKFFNDLNYDVIGIDLSSKMIKIAKKIVPAATFYKKDMSQMKFPKNSFDIAISILAFLHLPSKLHKKTLKNIHDILKSHGKFLISLTLEKEGEYTNKWIKETKMYWATGTFEKDLEIIKNLGFKLIWKKAFGPKNDRHIYFLFEK